jgi:hemolysin activation/secretion protein
VNLALNVEDHLPAHTSLEVNNQYTNNTSELRAIAAASYDDLFARLDSIAFQYQSSPQKTDEVAVWAASYTARLPDGRSKLAFFYIDSNSDVATVGDAGATISVLGKGKIFGSRYINPFYSSAAATHVFIGSVEYKDFAESILAADLFRTPISYINLSAGHTSAWRGEQQQWSLVSSVNFGVRGLSNSVEEFRNKRAEGIANYWLVRSDASYSRNLPWHLNLRLRGAGQYAVDPVISNEQFSIAGADGVRGYLEAEQLGDVGFKTSLELGLPAWKAFTERLQSGVFLFYDLGRMSRLEPLRSRTGELQEAINRTLRSAGAGLEFTLFQHFAGSLVWAYPFVAGSDDGTQEGDSRLHFSVRASW